MEHCPICSTAFVFQECAPCDNCGWDVPAEIEHLNANQHTYTTYEVYQGLQLTLCDFCSTSLADYEPSYFGFKNDESLNIADFRVVSNIQYARVIIDQICPTCSARATFLKFVSNIRRINETQHSQ